jgi:hypothetical protein
MLYASRYVVDPCIRIDVLVEDSLSEINNRIHIPLTSEKIRNQDNIDIG